MKISNLAFAMAALAGCASFCSVRAQDNVAQAAARAVMDKMLESPATNQVPAGIRMPETNATQVSQAKVEKKKPEPAAAEPAAKAAAGGLGLKPIVAPPLPISAAKQSQLKDLLDLYEANRISPVEYQKQRAAILAEPN
jgi:hypothetical protein